MKGNLDGSGIDVVFEGTEINQPEYLDLDPDSGILYWVNRDDSSLKRVNTAGTVIETVYTDGDRLDYMASGLELDAASKIIYWSSFAVEAGIFRINTDGSDFTEILTSPDVTSPDALALDTKNNFLYWAEGNSIKKAKTDGTGITDVITSGIHQPYTIHYHEETLYFTDTYDRNLYSYTDTLLELDDDLTVPLDIEIWDME
jgi:sugar lactone lactonase YvrE